MFRRKFARFRDLPRADQWVIVKAATLTMGAWAALRLMPFPRVHGLAQDSRAVERVGARSSHDPVELAALVSLSGSVIPWCANCLTQSLVLVWLLRRRGVAGVLRIGVEPREGGFGSHAWVELEGLPLNELPDVSGRFSVLAIGSPGPATGEARP